MFGSVEYSCASHRLSTEAKAALRFLNALPKHVKRFKVFLEVIYGKFEQSQSRRTRPDLTSNNMTASEADLVKEIKDLEVTLESLRKQRQDTEMKLKYSNPDMLSNLLEIRPILPRLYNDT
jgi:hypothetical protein